MASNPYVNKVVYGNSTLIDLSQDTATQADVAQGKYFHLPTGERVQGTGANDFIITVSYNSTTQMWEPDCTFAEYQTAFNAGKTITVQTDDPDNASADGTVYRSAGMEYVVRENASVLYHSTRRVVTHEYWYSFTASGVSLDDADDFVYPSGTLSINQNGTGIDVAAYARVDVAVPSTETNFVVTVSWNSTTQRWEPNKTFSEIQTAYNAGKTIAVVSSEQSVDSAVDGEYHTGANPYFEYWVRKYMDGYSPQTIRETGYHLTSSGINTEDEINYIRPSGNLAITQNGNNIDVANYSTVSVNVSGGSSKNIQVNQTGGYVRTNGYTSTGVSLTVAKAGTYNVSWTAWRSSSQGTMGTNLYKNSTAGTAQQTWTSTYGQHITLTNQTYAQGDVLTLYATAGSTSRYCYVGDLVIVEQ